MKVSFLLGAGFSAKAGYPIANMLNNAVSEVCLDDYFVHSDEHLVRLADCSNVDQIKANIDEYQNRPWHILVKKLIPYYRQLTEPFDYEKFYDFIIRDAKNDSSLCKWLKNKYGLGESGLSFTFQKIEELYQQLVMFLIHPEKGEPRDINNMYKGFLSVLKKYSKEGDVSVFTLNHDLLLEQLLYESNIDYSDGFSDLSLYRYVPSDGGETVCLPCYSDDYQGCIRLFKLHGSLNYYWVSSPCASDSISYANEAVIKTTCRLGEVIKVNQEGVSSVIQKVSPNFLTGMIKHSRYGTDFYKDLFDKFCDGLKESDLLIIIGYGFKDGGINKRIVDNIKSTGKILILDKFYETSGGIKHFQEEHSALSIFKGWEEMSSISLTDIDCLLRKSETM